MLSPHRLTGLLHASNSSKEFGDAATGKEGRLQRRTSMPLGDSENALKFQQGRGGGHKNGMRRGSMFVTPVTTGHEMSAKAAQGKMRRKSSSSSRSLMDILSGNSNLYAMKPNKSSQPQADDAMPDLTVLGVVSKRVSIGGSAAIGLKQFLNKIPLLSDTGTGSFSAGSANQPPVSIEVHGYSSHPTEAWEWLKCTCNIQPFKLKKVPHPIPQDVVRFVCLSDTHGRPLNPQNVPNGDVLIVAGDFTTCGHPQEIKAFNEFLGQLPHAYKVVICGNHELTFDQAWTPNFSLFPNIEKLLKVDRVSATRCVFREALTQANAANPRQLLTNCIHLEDSSVTLFDMKIYGSPWTPEFDGWAYNLPRGKVMLEKWNNIPNNTDILITHTPPLGCCDLTASGLRAGCVELLNTVVKRVRPRYHIFGHIHEGYGCATDGRTKFVNACLLDHTMKMTNQPLVFDVPLESDQPKSYYIKQKR